MLAFSPQRLPRSKSLGRGSRGYSLPLRKPPCHVSHRLLGLLRKAKASASKTVTKTRFSCSGSRAAPASWRAPDFKNVPEPKTRKLPSEGYVSSNASETSQTVNLTSVQMPASTTNSTDFPKLQRRRHFAETEIWNWNSAKPHAANHQGAYIFWRAYGL